MAKRLNDNQREAVMHKDGAMMVLAGPGSGKTTVILSRCKNLLKDENFKGKILVMTYTKATATEMKERFSFYKGNRAMFSTFHSLFFRVLRREYNYSVEKIINEDEKNKLLLKLVEEIDSNADDYDEVVSRFQSQMSFMVNEIIDVKNFTPKDIDKATFQHMYKGYTKYKNIHEKIDFDDMLIQCYELFKTDEKAVEYWRNEYQYIMVDEFQDINRVQYECLKFLSAPLNNVMVVGDDDQSIYGFRGARPDYLLEFEKHFPKCKKVILNENYRFHNGILNIANKVIRENKVRYEKDLQSFVDKTDYDAVKILTSHDVAEESVKIAEKIQDYANKNNIKYSDMAIIYRTNIQGGAFAKELSKKGIPFILRDAGSNIYNHWIVKDLMAYLELGENIDNNSAFLRIVNKPKRYISKDFLKEAEELDYPIFRACFACPSLKKWQEENLYDLQQQIAYLKKLPVDKALKYIRNRIGYDDYLREYSIFRHSNFNNMIEIAEEITEISKDVKSVQEFKDLLEHLSTEIKENSNKNPHQTNAVNLTTMHGAKGLEFSVVFLPTLIDGVVPHERNELIEEERRLFYVGITRAKQVLYLSTVKEHYGKSAKVSPFLKKLSKKKL